MIKAITFEQALSFTSAFKEEHVTTGAAMRGALSPGQYYDGGMFRNYNRRGRKQRTWRIRAHRLFCRVAKRTVH